MAVFTRLGKEQLELQRECSYSRRGLFSEEQDTAQRVTSKVWVEQLLPGVAQQSVGEDEVQSAQQQVVGVHQVVADHREVP